MPPVPSQPLIQDGRIVLYPAPDRDVIHCKTALRHHFLQVAVAERVPQIPSNAQNDDHVLEVPSSEQRWSLWAHGITYQISQPARVCAGALWKATGIRASRQNCWEYCSSAIRTS